MSTVDPYDPGQPHEGDPIEDEFWAEYAEAMGDPLPTELPDGVFD